MERELDNPQNPDMSPAAIDERFRMVEALRKLCVSLKEAGERGPIGDARTAPNRAVEASIPSPGDAIAGTGNGVPLLSPPSPGVPRP